LRLIALCPALRLRLIALCPALRLFGHPLPGLLRFRNALFLAENILFNSVECTGRPISESGLLFLLALELVILVKKSEELGTNIRLTLLLGHLVTFLDCRLGAGHRIDRRILIHGTLRARALARGTLRARTLARGAFATLLTRALLTRAPGTLARGAFTALRNLPRPACLSRSAVLRR
jgi:hypothetical protein